MRIDELLSKLVHDFGLKGHTQLEKFGSLLLFLFPVLAVSIRHWVSVLFLLIALLAILTLRSNLKSQSLTLTEGLLLALLALFFGVFLISSFLHGWNDGATRLLEREIRFLLMIPIYFLIKRLPDPVSAIGSGAVLAIFVTAVVVPVQAYGLGYGRDVGTYGPLFTGPISIMLLILALTWGEARLSGRARETFAILMFGLATLIAILTSRSAILGLAIVFLLYYLTIRKTWRQFVVVGGGVLALVLITELSDNALTPKFSEGALEAYRYLINDSTTLPQELGAVALRLEMWRSVGYFLADYPIWGVGGYNYPQVLAEYVGKGLVSPQILEHSHPHNLFAQIIVAKGVVGLCIFLVFYVLSFSFFLKRKHSEVKKNICRLGAIFLVALLAVSLTESAPVLKGNFIASWLLFYAVFMVGTSEQTSSTLEA